MTLQYKPVMNSISRKNIVKGMGSIWVEYLRSPKLFGILPTFRVACASTRHLFEKLVLSKSNDSDYEKLPTLLTFTINPDLTRLWYLFAKRALGDQMKIVIVDSSGKIEKKQFPDAEVIHLWNFHHSKKTDYMLYHVIQSRYLWLCDDDVFIVGSSALAQAENLFYEDETVAVVSFIPNDYDLVFDQRSYQAMGSYSIFLDRKVFIKERLSFLPVKSNNYQYNHGTGYYENADFANEQLLRRGYNVEFLLGNNNKYEYVCGFDGVDSARIRLLEGRENFISEIIKIDKPMARHRIIGAYCCWKVVDLYRLAFGEEPGWIPPVSLQELFTLVQRMGIQYEKAIHEQFQLYDARAQFIQNQINAVL